MTVGTDTSSLELSADIVAPSELGASERGQWHALMDASPALKSAFLSPEFAIACEDAYQRVRVAILHRGGNIAAFFPFQFADRTSQALGLAQRVGEEMSDVAGIIAGETFSITPAQLMAKSRLSAAYMSHVHESQAARGLTCTEWDRSFTMDVSRGAADYFDKLKQERPKFVADTLRKERKLEKNEGPLTVAFRAPANKALLDSLFRLKQEQYSRTGVENVLRRAERRTLIERLADIHSPYCDTVLSLISVKGEPIAYHLGLRCTNTLHYWFPTYEPRVGYGSPGRLIVWKMVEAAAENGVSMIDLGAGESQAKHQLSNGTYRVGKTVWSGGDWPALVARSYLSLQWRLRNIRRDRKPAGSDLAVLNN